MSEEINVLTQPEDGRLSEEPVAATSESDVVADETVNLEGNPEENEISTETIQEHGEDDDFDIDSSATPLPKSVIKRINKITADKHKTQKERDMLAYQLSQLQAQQAQKQQNMANLGERPQVDDFEDVRDYIKARDDYENRRRRVEYEEQLQAQQHEHEMQTQAYLSHLEQNFKAQSAKVMEKYPDFVAALAKSENQFTPVMVEAIQTSGYGAEIAYFLAKNPVEAKRICELNPVQTMLEIGRLETRFTKAPPKIKSGAEKVPLSIGASGAALNKPVTLADLAATKTLAEYQRLKAKYDSQS